MTFKQWTELCFCQIFSRAEYRKIEANASRYKTSFSKIGALSVYEDVVSLYSKKFVALHDLDFLVEKAKEVPEKAGVISLCEGHSLGTPSRSLGLIYPLAP